MEEYKKIKIALVDDHAGIRKTIAGYLAEMDLEVSIDAESGEELLKKLAIATDRPDVCLIDYSMPRMMGDELAAKLREAYPSIKLAAMTGNMDTTCLIKMIKNGCDSFFIKSSNPLEWHRGIVALLNKGHYYTEWMEQSLLQLIRIGGLP
ncbi:MAG: hypothetical protein BGO69_05345 [Bacteroidetes bacterium 46-16]|nr:MAG: hypothetical protein BGO69_05345 [Bacteroidetes bacterium 46-16]